MDDDLAGRISYEQVRVAERVERSRKLRDRAVERIHASDAYAAVVATRCEARVDRLAARLPRRFGLSAPQDDRPFGEQLRFLLALAGAVYPAARSASLTAVHVTVSDPPRHTDAVGLSRAASLGVFTAAATEITRILEGAAGAGAAGISGAVPTRAPTEPARLGDTGLDTGLDAGLVDVSQYAVGEGPCLDAVEMDQVAVIAAPDLDNEDVRACWPHASGMLRSLGVRAAVSVAIPWSRRWNGRPNPERPPVATINLYATAAHALDRGDGVGLLLAAYAGSQLTGKSPAEVMDAAILRPRWTPPGWDLTDPDETDPDEAPGQRADRRPEQPPDPRPDAN